jgi:hypothetical protein
VVQRQCNGSATVVLPCGERGATVVHRNHSHVDRDPHGSGSGVLPVCPRCNTVEPSQPLGLSAGVLPSALPASRPVSLAEALGIQCLGTGTTPRQPLARCLSMARGTATLRRPKARRLWPGRPRRPGLPMSLAAGEAGGQRAERQWRRNCKFSIFNFKEAGGQRAGRQGRWGS